MFYVYGLFKKNFEANNELYKLFYIGFTHDIKRRIKEHRSERKYNIIKYNIIKKYDFYEKILFQTENELDALRWEQFLIFHYGRLISKDGFLSNLSEGEQCKSTNLRNQQLLIPYEEIIIIIENFKKSGLRQKEFAKSINIKSSILCKWIHKYSDIKIKNKDRVDKDKMISLIKDYENSKLSQSEFISINKISRGSFQRFLEKYGTINRERFDLHKPLSQYQIESIISFKKLGISNTEILKKMNLSRSAVNSHWNKYCKENIIKVKKINKSERSVINKYVIKSIFRMKKFGFKIREISEVLCIGKTSIYKHLKKIKEC